jgi:hypothetical protein
MNLTEYNKKHLSTDDIASIIKHMKYSDETFINFFVEQIKKHNNVVDNFDSFISEVIDVYDEMLIEMALDYKNDTVDKSNMFLLNDAEIDNLDDEIIDNLDDDLGYELKDPNEIIDNVIDNIFYNL